MNKILYHIKPGTSNFFLGDFPDEQDYGKNCKEKLTCYEGSCKCWHTHLWTYEACKEEAIKNGEIVNPEFIPRLDSFLKSCNDGDIFDLPEGLSFEKEVKNHAYDTRQVRLISKEETQEELWQEFFNRFVPGTMETFEQHRNGILDFTITRK